MSFETITCTLDDGAGVFFDAHDSTADDVTPEITWYDVFTTVLGG
jgi:hypothetical protein